MSTPARTASSYKFGQIGRRNAFFGRCGVRTALLAACGAVLVAGCNQVGSGLNSNLPPAGGGGLLSFTSVAMPDGIAGRAYSKVAVTSVETKSKTNFPISPAAASGTAPLASCTVSAGTLPPGMNAALTVDSTGAGCVIGGTPSVAAAGNTYQFTVQALDSNSPPRAAAQTFTMKVRPEFTVTAPAAIVGGALPAGVQGRTYGQIAANAAAMTATTNLSATTGNGAVGAKNYCALSVTPALATLTLTQVVGTNSCQLQGSAALAAAGSYKVTVSVTDSPILDPETNLPAVPANTIAAASNATLNVAAPLKIIAQADGVSAAPPAAVQGRAYGTGSNCSGGACLPLTYVSSGGLPAVEPTDSYLFSSSPALAAAGINCAASASSSVAKTTCSGTAGTAGTANYSVTVDDPGNLATPSGSASATTASVSGLSLTVDSALSLAVSPDPATNPAVQNRAYGTGTGCTGAGGACVAPSYTPSGGLGTYSFPAITGAPPAGITCAPNGGNTAVVCSGMASAIAATSSFTVAVSDVANASTPSANVSVPKILTVAPALSLSAPASSPADAVNLRGYGSNGTVLNTCAGSVACQSVNFGISGGLAPYSTATVTTATGTWSCPLVGSNYECATNSVSYAGALPASNVPLSLTASDTANATTSSQTTSQATANLTIEAPLQLAAPASMLDAVNGRPYGSTGTCSPNPSCQAISYSASGGILPYVFSTSSAFPAGFGCNQVAATYSCDSANVTAGAATYNPRVSVSDTGNAYTPPSAQLSPISSLTVQPPLTLTVLATADPATNPAVADRDYGIATDSGCSGVGGKCAPPVYTAAGGLPPYSLVPPPLFPAAGSSPDGIACVVASATTVACSGHATPTAATSIFSVSASDTASASVPADVNKTTTSTITVKPVLSLSAPVSLDSVNGRSYGSNASIPETCAGSIACQPEKFTISGGLGGYSAAAIGPSPGTWVCPLVSSDYQCATSAVSFGGSLPATSVPLTLAATDTGNVTTPLASVNQTANFRIEPELQVQLTTPASIQPAVQGRTYGQTSSTCASAQPCAPLTYTGSNGLPPYSFSNGGFPGFSCAPTGLTTYACSSPAVAGPAGSDPVHVDLSDNGNASVPPPSTPASASGTLTVHPELSLTLAPDPNNLPDAVNSRDYGNSALPGCAGATCVTPTYTAADGLAPYIFTVPPTSGPGSTPTGITCTTNAGDTAVLCSGTPSVVGAKTFAVSVTDTANASTPSAASPQNITKPLNVDADLQITTSSIPNFLKGYAYPAASSVPIAASGGIGTKTWVTSSGVPTGACVAPLGAPPAGIGLNAATGALTGAPTTASAAAGDVTFGVCVTDTGDSATPAGFNSSGFAVTTVDTKAYLASSSTNTVEVFQTAPGSSVSRTPQEITFAGAEPTGIAVTPDGLHAYVTLNGADQIGVIDAVTDTKETPVDITQGTGAAAPFGPVGIAISPDGSSIYVADATSEDVKVFNSSLVLQATIDTSPARPEYVAFKPDGSRAYVTTDSDTLLIVNASTHAIVGSSPFSLSSTGPHPKGIAVIPNGSGSFLAYIAKNGSGTAAGAVDIVDVTNDSPTSLNMTTIDTDSGSAPFSDPTMVVADPENARVYVPLTGSNQLATFNASPAEVGSPIDLATLLGLAGTASSPQGIAIPPLSPLPAKGEIVFVGFTDSSAGSPIGMLNNSDQTKDTNDGTNPFLLPTTTAASQIANIPLPK